MKVYGNIYLSVKDHRVYLICWTFILLFLFLTFIVSLFLLDAFSESSFLHQQIIDESLEFSSNAVIPFGDIKIIDYKSKGQILNITLWLHSIIPNEDNSLKDNKIKELKYGILIDGDSNKATGWDGIDYEITYTWAQRFDQYGNLTESWERKIEEHVGQGMSRILNGPIKVKDFNQPGDRFVQITIDLSKLGVDNNYKVMSYAQVIKDIKYIDYTSWIKFPPDQVKILTFPDPITIRKGSQKDISIMLKFNGLHNFSETTIKPLMSNKNIEIRKISSNSEVDQYLKPVVFNINTEHSPSIGKYTIPLQISAKTLEIIPLIQSNRFIPSTESTISEILNLDITVEEKFTLTFENFWNSYGDFISFMLAGFIGGASTYFFDYIKNRKKSSKNKIDYTY